MHYCTSQCERRLSLRTALGNEIHKPDVCGPRSPGPVDRGLHPLDDCLRCLEARLIAGLTAVSPGALGGRRRAKMRHPQTSSNRATETEVFKKCSPFDSI